MIGVAELCNKTTGLHFTRFDEEIATAFSIYCGISISNSLLYKKVSESQVRSKLSNELMMFHMKVSAKVVLGVLGLGVFLFLSFFFRFTYMVLVGFLGGVW